MLQRLRSWPGFPYVLPFFIFGVFLSFESLENKAWLYPLKAVSTALVIAWVWALLPKIEIKSPVLSIGVGVLCVVAWVGLEPFLVGSTDKSPTFNPWSLGTGATAYAWIAVRVACASLIVPIMEELFWRGFLMRYLIQENFEKIALGTYQHLSFWATTAAFAAVHGAHWPLAVVAGLLFGGLFLKTKSLGDVMLAHGVTNLLLGIYVLRTERWGFW